jgi:hypothetical protein
MMVFAEGKRQAHPGDIHHVLKLMEQKYSELNGKGNILVRIYKENFLKKIFSERALHF